MAQVGKSVLLVQYVPLGVQVDLSILESSVRHDL